MVGWKRWAYKKLGWEYETPVQADPAAKRGKNEMLKQIRNSKLKLKPVPAKKEAQTEPVLVKVTKRNKKKKKKSSVVTPRS